MREAMNAVIYQGMSISKAAEMHGVPRTTLNDHVLGKVLPGAKCGAPTVLSTSEEQDLVDFLIKSASIGCGQTRKVVVDIVSCMLSNRPETEVGHKRMVGKIYQVPPSFVSENACHSLCC